MENELKEGVYLAAGSKEVPIPYTQDPLLKGDKADMEQDSEILKGGELRAEQDEDDANNKEANGKKSPKGSINKKAAFGGGAEGSEGGSGMAESYNEFKLGDTVCLNNIKNREWIIESIQINESENYAKFSLRSGMRKMIVRPDEMIVEHIEGVEIHRERFEDSVSDLRKIYENMELNDACKDEVVAEAATPEVADPEIMQKPIMERKALYAHIKEMGLHTNGDRGAALQKLGETCGNSMEEVHTIYEDACLSERNQNIDTSYDYAGADQYNESNTELMSELSDAYADIEKKEKEELEETAKKSDEEVDRGGKRSPTDAGLSLGL